MTSLPRFLAALTACLVTFTGALMVPGPASAAGPEYVALGDSYASGVGTRLYDDSSGSCRRSRHAYPVDVAARLGATLRFRACFGATVADVGGRLRGLDRATRWVTVQVGGNDAGFARVVTECAEPAWAQHCKRAVARARSIITDRLPRRLADLYRAIRRRASSATVVVVGYPRLFNDEDCNAGTWFSPSDRALLNDTADLLNSRISSRASAAGFRFVNPTRAFLGHAVCDDPEWVNGLSHPVTESYHPNRAGQDAYGRLVTGRLR